MQYAMTVVSLIDHGNFKWPNGPNPEPICVQASEHLKPVISRTDGHSFEIAILEKNTWK